MNSITPNELGQSFFDVAPSCAAMKGVGVGGVGEPQAARPDASYRLEPLDSNLNSDHIVGFAAVIPCKCGVERATSADQLSAGGFVKTCSPKLITSERPQCSR